MREDKRLKIIDLITILYILFTVASVVCMIMAIRVSLECLFCDVASWCVLSIFGLIAMLICNMFLIFTPTERLFKKIGRKRNRRRKYEDKN